MRTVSKNDVNGALAAFNAIINAIAKHYLDSETRFDPTPRIDGAEHLLYVIDDGLEARRVIAQGPTQS